MTQKKPAGLGGPGGRRSGAYGLIISEILSRLNRVTETGNGWRASCPVPGHGKGRGDRNPSLSLREASDGTVLVHCMGGCDTDDVLRAIGLEMRDLFPEADNGQHANGTPTLAKAPAPDNERARAALNRVQQESLADDGTIAAYLRHRGLSGDVPESLRRHDALSYWDDGQELGKFPAMLALVTGPDGKPVTFHRTYLAPGGAGKADVPAPKKMMPPVRPGATRGAAIRLTDAARDTLAVAEGIETTQAVHEATGQDAWATISAGGMAAVEIPEHVRTVYVWADHDPDTDGRRGAGQVAAEKLAERLHAEGRTAYVLLPPEPGTDWLDVFVADGPEALRAALHAAEPWGPAGDEAEGFTLTDLGNARRLVAQHGKNIRYCYAENRWYVWNGRIWEPDETGEIMRLAKETVGTIYAEAAEVVA